MHPPLPPTPLEGKLLYREIISVIVCNYNLNTRQPQNFLQRPLDVTSIWVLNLTFCLLCPTHLAH